MNLNILDVPVGKTKVVLRNDSTFYDSDWSDLYGYIDGYIQYEDYVAGIFVNVYSGFIEKIDIRHLKVINDLEWMKMVSSKA